MTQVATAVAYHEAAAARQLLFTSVSRALDNSDSQSLPSFLLTHGSDLHSAVGSHADEISKLP
jgi:hypothetical protein